MRNIGVSGNAMSGKNTLAKIIQKRFENSAFFEELSLAATLRQELEPFILETCGFSAFTEIREQKSFIRNLLVETAKLRRFGSKGTYYTKKLQPKIHEFLANGITPIITDLRFDEYEKDERWWLKEKNNGVLVHITRMLPNGMKLAPANSTEAENDPKMEAAADIKIVWPTTLDFAKLSELIEPQLIELWEKINQVS